MIFNLHYQPINNITKNTGLPMDDPCGFETKLYFNWAQSSEQLAVEYLHSMHESLEFEPGIHFWDFSNSCMDSNLIEGKTLHTTKGSTEFFYGVCGPPTRTRSAWCNNSQHISFTCLFLFCKKSSWIPPPRVRGGGLRKLTEIPTKNLPCPPLHLRRDYGNDLLGFC